MAVAEGARRWLGERLYGYLRTDLYTLSPVAVYSKQVSIVLLTRL